ncbi:transposase InsO family protein [Paraburkholderia youngii]
MDRQKSRGDALSPMLAHRRESARLGPSCALPRLQGRVRRDGLATNARQTGCLYGDGGLWLRMARREKRPGQLRGMMSGNDGACSVWLVDVASLEMRINGRRVRTLTMIDAWNRGCLNIQVEFTLVGVGVVSWGGWTGPATGQPPNLL